MNAPRLRSAQSVGKMALNLCWKKDSEENLPPPLLMSQERDLSSKWLESQDMASGFCPKGAQAAGGANMPRVEDRGYGKLKSEILGCVGSQGIESGYGSNYGSAEDLQDPEEKSRTKHAELPQVKDPAEHKWRDSICESDIRPRKDKAVVEIPKDALGAKNGSATKGTELPQLPDPAGHRQGEAASLLGQSESQLRNGIGEKCQDGSAMGVTHRKSLRGYLAPVEWIRSHPVLTLAVLTLLLLLAVALAVSLAAVSGTPRDIAVTPDTPDTPRLLACPHGWVGYHGICYFLSRDRLTWDQAQAQCSELEASLAVLNDKEMEFLFRLSRNVDYWIGLHRQDQRLQWVDGSNFNSSVPVLGNAPCVFLADNVLRSVSCSNKMQYMCSRAQTRL